jgi:hypothetical protein
MDLRELFWGVNNRMKKFKREVARDRKWNEERTPEEREKLLLMKLKGNLGKSWKKMKR